ncbi:MAG: sporulation protein YqfD [Firmicutes bacterium HGW-Firmicutes-14]|nr:MAG: sporulation protein YqfD [Firmicutes bacterium HGW-Firmicutes-14]
MLSRLWSYITGYVSVVIEGKNPEKLINMAVSRGLNLWDVQWTDNDRVRLKVRLNGIRALRHISRRTRCRFRITGKTGMPFRIARVRKRKVLLAGAVLCVLFVYMMSSFILFVEVEGNKEVPAERIISAAEDAGLAMGTWKRRMDKDRMERYIRDQIQEISWVGIKVTGTKAVIEVAEKKTAKPPDRRPADIVAAKDGMVTEILVLSGRAAAAEGDLVKRGDVLITGIIRPEPKPGETSGDEELEEDTGPPAPVKYVRANGIVRARTWYEGYAERRLVESGVKRTGKKVQVLSIRVCKKELIIKGPKSPPYLNFVTSADIKKLPEWRNLSIPVEIVTTNYYEVEKYRDIIGISEAKSQAFQKALDCARAGIPSGAKIIKEISEEIPARGSNVVRIKVVLEVVEEIGRVQPLKPEEMQLN